MKKKNLLLNRLARIECKCDLILSRLDRSRVTDKENSTDILINRLHALSRRMLESCKRERSMSRLTSGNTDKLC